MQASSLAQRQLMHEHVYTFPCSGEIPATAGWLALTTGKGRVISILLVLLMQRALMQRPVFGSLQKFRSFPLFWEERGYEKDGLVDYLRPHFGFELQSE